MGTDFSKAFFSDNGSTSVEVALKMCFQYWSNQGIPRKRMLAFKNSYHGDTFGTMAVAERGPFTRPFWPLLFEVDFISSVEDLQEILHNHPGEIAGLIYEPMVQGAGGMLMQDPVKLESILALVKSQGGLLIADEVMTGFGRTGKTFASHHLRTTPDIVCLSKGLTGGVLPLGLTVTTHKIFKAFESSDRTKTLFHGHSFTGNALACSAALASLELLLNDECQKKIQWIGEQESSFIPLITASTAPIKEVRQLGTILAIEFHVPHGSGYLNDLGPLMARYFMNEGILLRPLGNVLYVLPPYSFGPTEVDMTFTSILRFLRSHF